MIIINNRFRGSPSGGGREVASPLSIFSPSSSCPLFYVCAIKAGAVKLGGVKLGIKVWMRQQQGLEAVSRSGDGNYGSKGKCEVSAAGVQCRLQMFGELEA